MNFLALLYSPEQEEFSRQQYTLCTVPFHSSCSQLKEKANWHQAMMDTLLLYTLGIKGVVVL